MPFRVNEIPKNGFTFYEVQQKVNKRWVHFGPAKDKQYAQMLCDKANHQETKGKNFKPSNG